MGSNRLAPLTLLAVLAMQAQTNAPQAKLGDNSAGSRGQPAHILTLKDPEGDSIQPGDRHPLPFSTAQTCGGDCHDVERISRGWHFNAMLPGVPAGRNGQPWILVDRETATQIPLSYRPWPGTYRPQQVGMSSREFAVRFGGRTPGGMAAANGRDRRWTVSGNLDVNCLACHDASPGYDQAEYGRQVALQNFRYAAAAASGLALVTGSAREMPDLFDYLLPAAVEDSLHPRIPRVEYAPGRFLPSGKVAFDIVREVKNSRCYYCHTNADVELTGASRWKANEDVHLARGITCVQCHRNGLDHMITRGTEGAGEVSLTCQGCHMEQKGMGAPHPDHEGIPPVHFAKLTCTACHSGPRPGPNTRQLKNGMTHGLGEYNVNKAAQALPHIYYPVFARQEDGKIGPNRLVWPAFWGRLRNGVVEPLDPEQVKKVVHASVSGDGSWPNVDQQWVEQVLRVLDADGQSHGPAVYIAGGKLHRLDGAGRLQAEEHAQAQPYLWPLAHDVRSASQALGAKGCEDCHSTEAAVFFGNVAVDSPLAAERVAAWKMNRFQKGLDPVYQARLAGTWRYRGWLKISGFVAAALLLFLLLAYALRAVERLSAATTRLRMPVNIVGMVSLAAVSATGIYSLLSKGHAMTGDRLLWHVGSAPAFAIAAVAITLFWAHRNRFATADWQGPWAVPLRKIFFWIAVPLSVATIASILAAMLPLFGAGAQQSLVLIHRCCAVSLTASGFLFAGFALVTSRKGGAN